jgi:hypothetical protein
MQTMLSYVVLSSWVWLILRPTVSRPVYLGIEHPSGALRPDFSCCRTVAGLLIRGALSDERTGLSFISAPGPRQRSHFRARVSWNSWPTFSVPDSKLPFLSPRTTRRAMVEVFDPASTRDSPCYLPVSVVALSSSIPTVWETPWPTLRFQGLAELLPWRRVLLTLKRGWLRCCGNVFIRPLLSIWWRLNSDWQASELMWAVPTRHIFA